MIFYALFCISLILIVGMRFITFSNTHFEEPDEYIYALIAQNIISNGTWTQPALWTDNTIPLTTYAEKPLLVLIPAAIVYLTGLSFYVAIGILAPLLAGILFILTYIYALQLVENRLYALAGALLFMTMLASIFHTVSGEWRGEELTMVFTLCGLIATNKITSTMAWRKILLVPAVVSLSIFSLYFAWSGAVYGILVIAASLCTAVLRIIIHDNRKFLLLLTALAITTVASVLLLYPPLLSILNSYRVMAETFPPTVLFWFLAYGFAVLPLCAIAAVKILIVQKRSAAVSLLRQKQLALIIFLSSSFILAAYEIRFSFFFALPLSIAAVWLFKSLRWSRVLLILIVALLIYDIAFYLPNLAPADNINPQFNAALYWLKDNTAPNATVLTLWEDGSLVEYVANRTSFSDSMAGNTHLNNFALFLYAQQCNYTYLNIAHPSYLLVRYYWQYVNTSLDLTNISNRPYNNTNIAGFMRNNTCSGLSLVYRNNDTSIYKVYS